MKKGVIYLIPNYLGEEKDPLLLPAYLREVINSIKYFAVEEIRSARQLLKSIDKGIIIDDLKFFILNEQSADSEPASFLHPVLEGNDLGIISEAGCPGIADPGAELVKLAHEQHIKVVPLTGPSSILLSLMASGLNGQSFSFEGYLPKERNDRIKKIKELERSILSTGQTKIFIETPYRNNHLLEDLLLHCNPQVKLCIATNINTSKESIYTRKIADWKKQSPDLSKKPTVFLLGS